MDRIIQLDAIVAQFNLNGHPFYQEWREGRLPTEKLCSYAAEYGEFIGTIAAGWDTLGAPHYADEEREHERLWSDFQTELCAGSEASLPSTATLVTAARNLFGDPSSAYGALYAFEAQQPLTSQSKLDGLNEHYNVSPAAKRYFEVHAMDFAEVELLKARVAGLSDEEFAQTKTACAIVCSAMWGALDGIYYAQTLATA